jgi:hypothetical protein
VSYFSFEWRDDELFQNIDWYQGDKLKNDQLACKIKA